MSTFTTFPRMAAGLQYKLVRLPYTLLESTVVTKLLADDSALRLSFEKALGSLDERAGRFLGDPQLEKRGAALRRRSDVLGTAVKLETKAQTRKAEAEQTLKAEKKAAGQERSEAQQTRVQGLQEARQTERDEKARIAHESEAREKAEKQRVEAAAEQRKQDAQHKADAAKKRIEADEKADTEAPKAQLKEASELAKEADKKRSKAERLGDLADVEKETRRAEREARTS